MIEMNLKKRAMQGKTKSISCAKSIDLRGNASRTIICPTPRRWTRRRRWYVWCGKERRKERKKERKGKKNGIVKRTRDGTKTSSKRIFRFLPRGKRASRRGGGFQFTRTRETLVKLVQSRNERVPTRCVTHRETMRQRCFTLTILHFQRSARVYSHSCLIYIARI